MAVRLLSHEVSDLCIGKPPLKSLPVTSTVGEALFALKLCGDTFFVTASAASDSIVGKICMVDLLCYLCAESNIATPASALENPISALLPKEGDSHLHIVEPNSSILNALDLMLDGKTQTVMVPISPSSYSKHQEFCSVTQKDLIHHHQEFCSVTQEDLIRFFLNNIFLFSSVAHLSVAALGLVRPALLSVLHHDPAISALPLIRSALDSNTSVPVITSNGKLIGEISPSTLSTCDETVAPAIASLSAGDLMAYIDSCNCGTRPESVVQAVKNRLKKKGMEGMLELMDGESAALSSSLSCSVSSAASNKIVHTHRMCEWCFLEPNLYTFKPQALSKLIATDTVINGNSSQQKSSEFSPWGCSFHRRAPSDMLRKSCNMPAAAAARTSAAT